MAHPPNLRGRFKKPQRGIPQQRQPLAKKLGAVETFVLPIDPRYRGHANLMTGKSAPPVVLKGNEAVVRGKRSFWRVIFRKENAAS